MREGDSGNGVLELKRDLDRWGFNPGVISDEFNAKTKEAVIAVQQKLGLERTGVVDDEFVRAVENDLQSNDSKLTDRLDLKQTSLKRASVAEMALAIRASDVDEKVQMAGLPAVFTSPVLWIVLGGAVIWMMTRKKVNFELDAFDPGEDAEEEHTIESDIEEIRAGVEKVKSTKRRESPEKNGDANVIDAEIVERDITDSE